MAGITTLVPWFGSNRSNAAMPAEYLKGCSWIGVPFAGGMCEVQHFDARTILVNDAHRHLINLAMVAACPVKGPALYRKLKRQILHPETLDEAQDQCLQWDDAEFGLGDDELAAYYFITAWMGRSGLAGTDREFYSSLALRWTASGGDSAKRYQSAVKFLNSFPRNMRRCTFSCMDCFDFLDEVKDDPKHGVYEDPPWPKDGDDYKHKFTEKDQRRLAEKNASFKDCRFVIRYGDHPLIRELYPEDHWEWHMVTGRTQANNDKSEVLLVNRRYP